MPRDHTKLLLALVTCTWIATVAGAFWMLEFRYWRSFSDEQLAVFNGESIRLLPAGLRESDQITVIHFVDPDCPCTRYTRSHLEELADDLRGTRQMSLSKVPDDGELIPALQQIEAAHAAQLRVQIPASPAIGIWDKHGKLAYFGPYSSGAICGSGRSFVKAALDTLRSGENPLFINTDATGCFCNWGDNNS